MLQRNLVWDTKIRFSGIFFSWPSYSNFRCAPIVQQAVCSFSCCTDYAHQIISTCQLRFENIGFTYYEKIFNGQMSCAISYVIIWTDMSKSCVILPTAAACVHCNKTPLPVRANTNQCTMIMRLFLAAVAPLVLSCIAMRIPLNTCENCSWLGKGKSACWEILYGCPCVTRSVVFNLGLQLESFFPPDLMQWFCI